MTADEAIRRIQHHIDVHRIGEYPHIKLGEALNMAISALREWEKRRRIPVAERFPEENGCYIVVACDEGCSAGEGIWYDTVVVVAEYYKGSWDCTKTEQSMTLRILSRTGRPCRNRRRSDMENLPY